MEEEQLKRLIQCVHFCGETLEGLRDSDWNAEPSLYRAIGLQLRECADLLDSPRETVPLTSQVAELRHVQVKHSARIALLEASGRFKGGKEK